MGSLQEDPAIAASTIDIRTATVPFSKFFWPAEGVDKEGEAPLDHHGLESFDCLERLQGACDLRGRRGECVDPSRISAAVLPLTLPIAVPEPPLLPSHVVSSFWQADGSFQCNWRALKTGTAFCSSVQAACTFCLTRALGGPSALMASLLEKLRTAAKVAIEDEVGRLIQSVKNAAIKAAGEDVCSVETAKQELMKHPALQAVAFLSVHERRLAVFEVSHSFYSGKRRWQMLPKA